MSGLLVSVRDAEEAEIALAGGVDLLDVKEPDRGSLGAASPEVWQDVQQRCRGRVLLSAALGELHEAEALVDGRMLYGFDFVKTGLAGCRGDRSWLPRWRALLQRLPQSALPVAVVYADWQSCAAPTPAEILAAAADLGCPAVLFDTHGKDQGDLFVHQSLSELAGCVAAVRRFGGRVVLAGSLTGCSLDAALALQPDYVAVRGAVCRDGRRGPLDPRRIAEFRRRLSPPASRAFG